MLLIALFLWYYSMPAELRIQLHIMMETRRIQ